MGISSTKTDLGVRIHPSIQNLSFLTRPLGRQRLSGTQAMRRLVSAQSGGRDGAQTCGHRRDHRPTPSTAPEGHRVPEQGDSPDLPSVPILTEKGLHF